MILIILIFVPSGDIGILNLVHDLVLYKETDALSEHDMTYICHCEIMCDKMYDIYERYHGHYCLWILNKTQSIPYERNN